MFSLKIIFAEGTSNSWALFIQKRCKCKFVICFAFRRQKVHRLCEIWVKESQKLFSTLRNHSLCYLFPLISQYFCQWLNWVEWDEGDLCEIPFVRPGTGALMRWLLWQGEEGAGGCSAHCSTSQPGLLGDAVSIAPELWALSFLLLCWKRGEESPSKPIPEVICVWAVA